MERCLSYAVIITLPDKHLIYSLSITYAFHNYKYNFYYDCVIIFTIKINKDYAN